MILNSMGSVSGNSNPDAIMNALHYLSDKKVSAYSFNSSSHSAYNLINISGVGKVMFIYVEAINNDPPNVYFSKDNSAEVQIFESGYSSGLSTLIAHENFIFLNTGAAAVASSLSTFNYNLMVCDSIGLSGSASVSVNKSDYETFYIGSSSSSASPQMRLTGATSPKYRSGTHTNGFWGSTSFVNIVSDGGEMDFNTSFRIRVDASSGAKGYVQVATN